MNVAVEGQGDDAMLSFVSLKWGGKALGMRSKGTSENYAAIMDWRKVTLSEQKQLHNKQKAFVSSVHGLALHHILCTCLTVKVLQELYTKVRLIINIVDDSFTL